MSDTSIVLRIIPVSYLSALGVRRPHRMIERHVMAYRRQWASLFLSQHGQCALCGGVLSEETGWHDHHLIHRVAGGSDSLSNRVLLHPVCHARVHANGLTVAKPASE